MDPKLQEMLNKTYDGMKSAGKSDKEIESATRELYTKYQSGEFGGAKTSTETKSEPGLVQGIAQSIAKPFLKGVSTVAAAGERVFTDTTTPDTNKIIQQGIDYGYFGTVKPFGAEAFSKVQQGEIGSSEFVTRAGMDVAGGIAEQYSYAMAPLKTGIGFWNTVKSALPMAATYGTSQGLQKAGEGGTVGDVAGNTVGNTVGAIAGYGILKGGANFFAKWGARALQTEAVRTSGAWAKDFAEKAWGALPEAFQKKAVDLSTEVGVSAKRTINALRTEFNKNWKTASDTAVDSVMPSVNQPELALGKFQRNVASQMGGQFKASNTLYDNVKADTTTIDAFGAAQAALGKAPSKTVVSGKVTPEQLAQIQKDAASQSTAFTNFMETMKPSINQPLTLKQVLDLNREALEYVPGATPPERQIIREFAAGLFGDARTQLEKKNPELLDQWDFAYQTWKKASDTYESSVLNNLKTSGDVDTIVDKMINKTMTREEQDIFLASVAGNEQATQDLFISSVLQKAKAAKTQDESAKILNQFLDNWDVGDGTSRFLTPEQASMIDDLANLYNGSFDEFVAGMREMQGFSAETAKDLYDAQGKVQVTKFINEGRFDEIADGFAKLKDDPQFAKAVAVLKPEEKQALGVAITKDMFDTNLGFAAKNPDGTYLIDNAWSDSYVKMYENITGIAEGKQTNSALLEIFSPEQLANMKSAYMTAKGSQDLSAVPQTKFNQIVHALAAVLYLGKGLYAGAVHHTMVGAAPTAPSAAYYSEVDRLIEQGLLKANARIKIGDIISTLFAKEAGQVTDKTIEEAMN